jgi:hypothetical protein
MRGFLSGRRGGKLVTIGSSLTAAWLVSESGSSDILCGDLNRLVCLY